MSTKIVVHEAGVAVAGQLVAADFAAIAAAGYRTIVNNRPDGEDAGQMPSETARLLAERHGMAYHHLPLRGFETTDSDKVAAFEALAARLEGPVLYYCRTGTRCTLLWAQLAVRRLGVEKVTAIAAANGYDVSVIREELEERSAAAAKAA
jgi:sulfide:quinone oxidoreductase